jgi:hypothetical protein
MAEAHRAWTAEAALAERWAAGVERALRLEDGRALRVVFPGVPGGGAGPDFSGAILDAGGDYLRGAVELHLRASGWAAHGHDRDPAYAGVVLHVVGENDSSQAVTHHLGGRAIPILVLRPRARGAFPPPFTPPCAIKSAAGMDPGPVLERMGLRRLRMKAARIAPFVAAEGRAQALYTLLLETLAGPANRSAFGTLARDLPLAPLLERVAEGSRTTPDRVFALGAELKGAAATLALKRAGLRPAAAPGKRIEAAARLVNRLWPEGGEPLALAGSAADLVRLLAVPGVGRATAIELAVNAVLPIMLATGEDERAASLFRGLASPGTYGKLRSLEGWLGTRPFASAAMLQGGLLLHGDYCTRGLCGRCPLSSGDAV